MTEFSHNFRVYPYPYPFICSQNKQEIRMNKIAIEPDNKAQQCTNSCPHQASKNEIKI